MAKRRSQILATLRQLRRAQAEKGRELWSWLISIYLSHQKNTHLGEEAVFGRLDGQR